MSWSRTLPGLVALNLPALVAVIALAFAAGSLWIVRRGLDWATRGAK